MAGEHILDALKIRRDEIAGKRKARAGQPGYAQNVAHIDQAIAELDAEIAKRSAGSDGPSEDQPSGTIP